MPQPIDEIVAGGQTIAVYDPSDLESPHIEIRRPGKTPGGLALDSDPSAADTNMRSKVGSNGAEYGIVNELQRLVDDFSDYTVDEPPPPWDQTGGPYPWQVKDGRGWASNGRVYRLIGETQSGSPTRHSHGSIPGDGLPEYCPSPPFDIYIRFRLDDNGNEDEFSFQWNAQYRDYSGWKNTVEYELDNDTVFIGQKEPNAGFNRNDIDKSAGLSANTTIKTHIRQRADGHWTMDDSEGNNLDTRNDDQPPEDITDDYYGWSFSVEEYDVVEIDYIEIDK
jgi:hypothetical protein